MKHGTVHDTYKTAVSVCVEPRLSVAVAAPPRPHQLCLPRRRRHREGGREGHRGGDGEPCVCRQNEFV